MAMMIHQLLLQLFQFFNKYFDSLEARKMAQQYAMKGDS